MPSEPAPSSRRPANQRERRRAVTVLLDGRETPPRRAAAGVDRFLEYARGQRLGLHLRTGRDHVGRPLAAAALAGPGRAAMVICSPLPDAAAAAGAAAVLDDLVGDLGPVRVAQALPEAGQGAEREAYRGAGFERLATLVYLEGPSGRPVGAPHGNAPTAGLREVPWSAGDRGLFERTLERTYEGTLDCPGLVGRRPIAEVLDGHRGAGGPGAFAAGRWRVFLEGDEPVAVLLLARLPAEPVLEVVYLGVCPGARGRGLGRALLHRALARAAADGAEKVVLAADAANAPALRLYRSAGFRTVQRRLAFARFRVPGGPRDAGDAARVRR